MTQVSDVTSRLLAKLDELEKAARAVPPLEHNFDMGGNRQDEVFTHGRIRYASEDGMPRSVSTNEQQHFDNWDPYAVLRLCQAHREIAAMFPASAPHLDTEGSFYGFQSRDCGEHRTVGAHRAWCFDCSEWCLPDQPCRRCHGVSEVLRIIAAGYGIQEED